MKKFVYYKGDAKRDKMIPVDRINGITPTDANTLVINIDQMANDYDGDQGTISFDITSGKAKEFCEEICECISKKAFTVLADDIVLESVSEFYADGAVAISNDV